MYVCIVKYTTMSTNTDKAKRPENYYYPKEDFLNEIFMFVFVFLF